MTLAQVHALSRGRIWLRGESRTSKPAAPSEVAEHLAAFAHLTSDGRSRLVTD